MYFQLVMDRKVLMETIAIFVLVALLVQLTLSQMHARKVQVLERDERAGILEGAWIVQALKEKEKQ